jgi:ABC-type uncharacterized transport system permease subunit
MHELTAILVTTVLASTPMLFAALGELVTEKSGVLNLGVEGMMLLGAVVGFSVTAATGHASFGILCAAIAGAATAAIFAVLTLIFLANQVACGLALTIFGIGLSALVGKPFLGRPLERIPQLHISGLSDIPLIGPLLFGQDALVYLSIVMAVAVHFFLNRTRPGLIVRAVGENHDAAHALGYPVVGIRFFAVLFGGAMCGIGGSYLSLAYTPLWSEGMTAGRGWIALACVTFSTWRSSRVVLGAYLFGFFTIAQLHAQAFGVKFPPEFLSMAPYLATIAVLVLISRKASMVRMHAPACLGKVFHSAG